MKKQTKMPPKEAESLLRCHTRKSSSSRKIDGHNHREGAVEKSSSSQKKKSSRRLSEEERERRWSSGSGGSGQQQKRSSDRKRCKSERSSSRGHPRRNSGEGNHPERCRHNREKENRNSHTFKHRQRSLSSESIFAPEAKRRDSPKKQRSALTIEAPPKKRGLESRWRSSTDVFPSQIAPPRGSLAKKSRGKPNEADQKSKSGIQLREGRKDGRPLQRVLSESLENLASSSAGISPASKFRFDIDRPRPQTAVNSRRNKDAESSVQTDQNDLTDEQKAWAGLERVLANNSSTSVATADVLPEAIVKALRPSRKRRESVTIPEDTELSADELVGKGVFDDMPELCNSSFSSLVTEATDMQSVLSYITTKAQNMIVQNHNGALESFLGAMTAAIEEKQRSENIFTSAEMDELNQVIGKISKKKGKKTVRKEIVKEKRNSRRVVDEDDHNASNSVEDLMEVQRFPNDDDTLHNSMPSLSTMQTHEVNSPGSHLLNHADHDDSDGSAAAEDLLDGRQFQNVDIDVHGSMPSLNTIQTKEIESPGSQPLTYAERDIHEDDPVMEYDSQSDSDESYQSQTDSVYEDEFYPSQGEVSGSQDDEESAVEQKSMPSSDEYAYYYGTEEPEHVSYTEDFAGDHVEGTFPLGLDTVPVFSEHVQEHESSFSMGLDTDAVFFGSSRQEKPSFPMGFGNDAVFSQSPQQQQEPKWDNKLQKPSPFRQNTRPETGSKKFQDRKKERSFKGRKSPGLSIKKKVHDEPTVTSSADFTDYFKTNDTESAAAPSSPSDSVRTEAKSSVTPRRSFIPATPLRRAASASPMRRSYVTSTPLRLRQNSQRSQSQRESPSLRNRVFNLSLFKSKKTDSLSVVDTGRSEAQFYPDDSNNEEDDFGGLLGS